LALKNRRVGQGRSSPFDYARTGLADPRAGLFPAGLSPREEIDVTNAIDTVGHDPGDGEDWSSVRSESSGESVEYLDGTEMGLASSVIPGG